MQQILFENDIIVQRNESRHCRYADRRPGVDGQVHDAVSLRLVRPRISTTENSNREWSSFLVAAQQSYFFFAPAISLLATKPSLLPSSCSNAVL